MKRMTPTSIAAALSFALVLSAAACKKSKPANYTDTAGGAVAPSTTAAPTATPSSNALAVKDLSLGRKLGTDKKVSDETDTFKPTETIYASVHTAGVAQGAKLTARWTFENGQLVNERSETISPNGDAYTEFHISKPSGWPEGKYTLHVLLNGNEVQTKDFQVKK